MYGSLSANEGRNTCAPVDLLGETRWFALSGPQAEGKGGAAPPVLVLAWLGGEVLALGQRRRVGWRTLCWSRLGLAEGSRLSA